MSSEYVNVEAESGENVGDTITRAKRLAGLTGLPVVMEHNGRTVRVQSGSDPEQVYEDWKRKGEVTQQSRAVGGVWVAYYPDWSGAAVFADEIGCLRYAVEHSATVGWWPFGAERQRIERSSS